MAPPRALDFAQDLKGQILVPILFWSLIQNSTKNYAVMKSPPSWWEIMNIIIKDKTH